VEYEVSLEDHQAFAEAALSAESWELARHHAERMLAMNSRERLLGEAADDGTQDEAIAEELGLKKAEGLMLLGWAQANLGEVDDAVRVFEEASQTASHNYVGFSEWPTADLDYYWAQALFELGDYQKALDRIAPRAVIGGDEQALALLRKAYLARGHAESAFDDFLKRRRVEIAKVIPTFSVYDYEGNPVSFEQVKGEVTLLAFWFPT
jgi:tetratricopeptide (TPR) repeat protein